MIAAADAALADVALNLGVSADILQAQLSTGDLLPALILAPQNGQDQIQILGQRVVAQLPADLHPGETVVLQVTGFNGNQILVRNLGLLDPANPAAFATVELPGEPAVDATQRQTAILTTSTAARAPAAAPANPAAQTQAPPAAQAQPIAPPREIFVAASVRPTPPVSPPGAASEAAPSAPQVRVDVLSARIAAAQTARSAPAPAPAAVPAAAGPAAAAATPPIVHAAGPLQNASQTVVRTVSDLLRAAGLPDTAFTRTAAAISSQAPGRLAPVLQRLENALARVTGDPRVSTLRTLIAFTSRLNLANEETLPAQIAAYVSHVIEGAETKLAQLLGAYAQNEESAPAQPDSQAQRAPAAPGPAEPAHPEGAQSPPPAQAAQVVQRAAAAEHDLKTLVLALMRDPPAARSSTLTQALSETQITLTGTQINVANANVQNPNTITLPLPAFYYEGGKPAYLRISRDGGGSRTPMDADNFHVAFVLDTANLGTVAIDVQTAGRAVKIDVKTEAAASASAFSQSLGSLRDRLEALRYRVSSAAAAVLTPGGNAAAAAQPAAPRVRTPGASQLDLHA